MGYYVVVDLEMCRVPARMRKEYRYKNEIIQIGAALMDDNLNVIDKFTEFVRPEYGHLDDFISKLTGIKSGDLIDAPVIEVALDDFLKWLPDDDIKAISWSDSDEKQFRFELGTKDIDINEKFEIFLITGSIVSHSFHSR